VVSRRLRYNGLKNLHRSGDGRLVSDYGAHPMDPLNKKEIGKRIKRLRKEKGLKQ